MLIDDRGSLFLQQDQRENISSLTLMSKGEKRFLLNVRGELSLNASVAINAKGGDCWQIQ
jgi:hypothetical protein